MAFADLTLGNYAEVNQSFVIQSQLPGGVDFIEDDATIGDTRRISIRHSNAGPSVVKGGKPIRRHLVQMTHEKWNADLGKTEKLVMNMTITNDPTTTFSETNIRDLWTFMVNFITDTNVKKLLRDEA